MGQSFTKFIERPSSRSSPSLPDEVVEEVLLRLPPDDPASLLRASLVCKAWCRLLSDRGFHRRFAQSHHTPPTLGFICNLKDENREVRSRTCEEFANFIPTSSFRPPRALNRQWRAVDARHGRVLLHTECQDPHAFTGDTFAIWDPIGGELKELPILQKYEGRLTWSVAVLCACGNTCDHLDCNQGPFHVVVVAAKLNHICAFTYSSKVGAWSMSTQLLHHNNDVDHLNIAVPSALVENELYFAFGLRDKILKYNLVMQEISVINAPTILLGRGMLTTTKGGCLGLAVIVFHHSLYLWMREAREVGLGGDVGWTMSRVIELRKLLPFSCIATPPCLVGADGTGAFFVLLGDGIYTVDVETSQVKKVCKVSGSRMIFPYVRFFTPALVAP
ncbi:unnamed protein product [Urochloa humidicola]